jgi:hypothetical protein
MPISYELPEVPNNEWIDKQFGFTGQWLPDLDPALIGPENYSVLRNLRYNDAGLEGVHGYTLVNSTPYSSFIHVDNAYHFRSEKIDVNTTGSYLLVHSHRPSDNKGVVHVGEIDVGSGSGEINQSAAFDENDGHDFDDSSVDLIGRFSAAPQNTCCYANSQDVQVYSGHQHRIAAAYAAMDREAATSKDISDFINNDTDAETFKIAENLIDNPYMETDDTWTDYGTPTTNARNSSRIKSGQYGWKFTVNAANEGMASAAYSITNGTTYRYGFWVYPEDHANVGTRILDGDGTELVAQADNAITQDAWNYVTGTFTATSTGNNAKIQINSGTDTTGSWFIDDAVVVEDGYYTNLILLTTRPIRGLYYNVKTVNTTTSTMNMNTWESSGWGSDLTITDNTDTGATLAADGTVTFSHTYGTSVLKYIQELQLYAYNVTIDAGKAEIQSVSCDPAFQPRSNVWDGVYREVLEFQVNPDGTKFSDYSLHVAQASDTTVPIGAEIGDCNGTSEIIIMFEEQMSGIRYIMLGDLVNTTNRTSTLSYWNGFSWTALTYATNLWIDGTLVGPDTFNATGTMHWIPPTNEEKQQLFDSTGYAYKLEFSGDLSGTNSEDIVIDLCYGIPSLSRTLDPFDFSVLYGRRLMLGSFSEGNEGNRMDYCLTDAPDVWNGAQSSEYGFQSLRYGGQDKLTAATQLYNRFGASVFSMLLVFKSTEVYLTVGDTPSTFEIYPVSQTIGCPAPLTLATAEVGLEIGEGLTRNIAIWVSHSGPIMFDGAVLQPIRGIENYFDPNESAYVEWDVMDEARGWVDQTYKEYNLLLPSGPGSATVNTWLVYDLMRKKWFQKDTATAESPITGFNVVDNTGEQLVFGGTDDGYLMYLENGTTWNGIPIIQQIRTGDFWPSENIWDSTLIRKFKFYTLKTQESNVDLDVTYYADTAANSGAGVFWQDQASGVSWADYTNGVQWADATSATLSLDLDASVGLQRVVRVISDLNRVGWAHAFEFEVETSGTAKGFQPIAWGIQYRIERKDNTATG